MYFNIFLSFIKFEILCFYERNRQMRNHEFGLFKEKIIEKLHKDILQLFFTLFVRFIKTASSF